MLSQQSHLFTSVCLSTQLLNTGMTLVLQLQNTDYVIYNIPQLAGSCFNSKSLQWNVEESSCYRWRTLLCQFKISKLCEPWWGRPYRLNGPDEQFLGGRLGAKAGIGGTYGAMPELFLKLNELITEKDLETARIAIHYRNHRKLTAAHGNMYCVIKEVWRSMKVWTLVQFVHHWRPVRRSSVRSSCSLDSWNQERFL